MARVRCRRRSKVLRVEPLEQRQLLSTVLRGSTLFVEGGDADDHVRVFMQGGNLVVRENGSAQQFDPAQVKNIVILAHGGDDRVIIDNSVKLPTTIRAGDGDDYIRGGGGSDEIYGGRGNDFLAGRDSDDWLYGQAGHDELRGGRGRDLLKGGRGRDRLRGGHDWDDYYADDQDDVPRHELREHRRGGKALETEYKAFMSGPGGMTAKAEYDVKRGAVVKKKFEVEVRGAPAGAVYAVFVAGTRVGTVRIGAGGRGKLELTTHPDSPHDQPFPSNFPAVSNGTVVKIGNVMSGKLRLWQS